MKVKFSKDFEKSVRKLSGKYLLSVQKVIQEVIDANNIDDLTDCKKLTDFKYVYRIRIGGYRAFFTFHIEIENDIVIFHYLISRGEAYSKKAETNLRKKDE